MNYTSRIVVDLCEMAFGILAETKHFDMRLIGGRTFHERVQCAHALALFAMNASPYETMELSDTDAIAIQTLISYSQEAKD